MADDDTTTATDDGTGQSSTGAADSNAADPAKVIEDLRKRQSGADKARDIAIAERDALKKEYDALIAGQRSSNQSADSQKTEAAIRAEVQAELERQYAEKTRTELAKVLDQTYPAARKKFPSLTDAAQLAELEAVFGEAPAAPKPIGNNPQGSAGQGAKRIEDMSTKELRDAADKQLADLLKPQS
jgi:hypothetical protein